MVFAQQRFYAFVLNVRNKHVINNSDILLEVLLISWYKQLLAHRPYFANTSVKRRTQLSEANES